MLTAFLLVCEIAGRAAGLHTPVLYEATAYGYRVRPGQDIRRFGNRVHYDRFGLRSDSALPMPAADVLRVLCLGDSITNGGTLTDQSDTYPYLLQQQLRAGERKVEVLNASVPGWAVANESGWLRANGTFGAHVVLLTIGTSDLFQEKAGSEIVDHHPSFPSQAPALALEELWLRYVLPHLLRQSFADPGTEALPDASPAPADIVTQALSIAEFVRQQDAIPLVLYVERPGRLEPSDLHVAAAKALLFKALQQHRISYLNTRDSFEQAGGASLFRDGVHPNADGNRVLARTAARLLAPVIGRTSPAPN